MKKEKLVKGHGGDVQFIELNKLPEGLNRIKNQPLAYGEISGHVHVLTGDVEMFEDDRYKYAKVGIKGALLQHVHERIVNDSVLTEVKELPKEDHFKIEFSEGVYKFGIHKRYNPFQKIFEKVID